MWKLGSCHFFFCRYPGDLLGQAQCHSFHPTSLTNLRGKWWVNWYLQSYLKMKRFHINVLTLYVHCFVSSIYQLNCWAVCFRAVSTQSCFASPWQHWTMKVSSSVVSFWSVWLTCSAGSLCPLASHPLCWHPFSILHVLAVIFGQRLRQDPSSTPTLPLLMGSLILGQCHQLQMVEGKTDSRVRVARWIGPGLVYSPWPVSMSLCQRTVCQWILRNTCCACSSRPSFYCRGWHERTTLIQSRAAYKNLMRGMGQSIIWH